MILSAFTRWANRPRLAKARREFNAARAEWKAAQERQDCRRMHTAHARLLRANHELMAAELACSPKPEPMPRGVAR